MGDDRIGATSVGKSVRSLLEALRSLEHEGEVLLQRLTERPSDKVRALVRAVSKISANARGLSTLRFLRAASGDAAVSGGLLADFFGLADEKTVVSLQGQVADLFEQVARLQEREAAVAGGLSQLRARAARFEDALAGLARIQGRFAARIGAQKGRFDRVEHLASRRDDHITRLIRDTAAQRSQIDRLVSELEAERRDRAPQAGDQKGAEPPIERRVVAVEKQFDDLRKAQKAGTQGVIDALEALRERLARLESRAVEMSREARAKSGRIDALARHVSIVEGRLSSAIGPRATTTVAQGVERTEAPAAVGQT